MSAAYLKRYFDETRKVDSSESFVVDGAGDVICAVMTYGEVIERFPDSSRIPDATLKLGYVAQERGDKDAARRLFNQILDQYPDSQAAGLAKQRLSRMGDG